MSDIVRPCVSALVVVLFVTIVLPEDRLGNDWAVDMKLPGRGVLSASRARLLMLVVLGARRNGLQLLPAAAAATATAAGAG